MRRRRRPAVEAGLRPRHELDSVVASVELTLISIVQGVALYFLTDSARTIIAEGRWAGVPYLVSALTIIMTVWARSLVHAFTVIRWPLELGHTFFYIGITLFEATLFTQIGSPARWFTLSAVLGVLFVIMFAYEQRMYRLRRQDSAGKVGRALLATLERDHRLSMWVLVPLSVAGWIACAVAVRRAPALFIDGGWHVVLGTLQALGLLGYLVYVIRFYRSITDQILAARSEWDAPSEADG